MPVYAGTFARQVIFDINNNLVSFAHLNGRAWQLAIDNDHSAFHSVGRYAVMSIAIRQIVRAVETSFAHREIVFNVETINAALR